MAKADIKKSKKSVSKKQEEKATKKVESSSSSSESSSEASDSSDSSDEDSSDEEEKKEEKKESSDSDSDSGSDSGSDSDSDSDSSDEEEEEKKEENKEEKKESSDSDSDSESESSEEEEEKSKKRKAEESTTESPEPETKKAKTEESDEPATLFVGRLSWNIDDDWLKREFEKYDGIIGARVITDRQSGRSKGFGYVDFNSKAVAEKALAEMNGVEIDGRPINVDLSNAKPRQQNSNERSNDRAKKFGDAKSEPSDTLFIGNLSFDADQNGVTEFFSEYGPIIGVRLPTHPETEQLKGFGYVQFSSVEDAQKALDNLNGEYLNNRAVRLDFSTPKPQNNNGRSFGGNRGGRDRNGGRGFGGDRNGGRNGGRNFGGSGANSTPVSQFKGSKKTFD